MTGFLKKILTPQSEKTITIVSGIPRSGTSMMMKMLEAGGIPALTDEIRTADTDNPKGYYEFERVKKMEKGDVNWLEEAQGKTVKVISALLKHLPSDYHYNVIFMRREIAEVLASQRKMLDNRGESTSEMDDEKLGMLFEKHLQGIDRWLQSQSNITYLPISYGDLLNDPLPQIEQLNKFLGHHLDVTKMAKIIDPSLYRNRLELDGE